jgi:hypothetical protein
MKPLITWTHDTMKWNFDFRKKADLSTYVRGLSAYVRWVFFVAMFFLNVVIMFHSIPAIVYTLLLMREPSFANKDIDLTPFVVMLGLTPPICVVSLAGMISDRESPWMFVPLFWVMLIFILIWIYVPE